MQSNPADPEKLAAAIDRLRRGEDTRAVARELGISTSAVSVLKREIERESRPSSEALRPIVAEIASQHGFVAEVKFSFSFPEVALPKSYNPDCVWFEGAPEERNTVALFEIDDRVSPKHRAGSVTLANFVALRLLKRILFFAIAPPECERVATATVEMHKRYLGDKWSLDALVIPSFDPSVIRDRIRSVLALRRTSSP